MKSFDTQKGFTLVELAIVMTIIGLLIGGILKGQELLANAKVTATIAQVRAYEAATTTFNDKYQAMPGDMSNASTRIPGCLPAAGSTICNPFATASATGTGGDNIVGLNNWGAAGWGTQTVALASPNTLVTQETTLFWTHLLLSDLISGVTSAAITGGTFAWGTTHPAAKINGGFVVGYGDGTVLPGTPATVTTKGPSGTILVLVSSPTTVLSAAVTSGQQPLTPTRAAQMDRKMDDGLPNSGYVQAYGTAASCYSVAAPFSATSPGYLESATTNDCGLAFRIQG